MGWRITKIVLVLGMMTAVSGAALAQRYGDYDDDDARGYSQASGAEARQRGYQRGYHDGFGKGAHEGRENDPYDYRTPDWQQATRGYRDWMGPADSYQRGYQEGYRDGFKNGFRSVRSGYGEPGTYFSSPGYGSPAYSIGYQDGASVAREDIERGKRFNSNPRGRYDDADHGYRREYGDKHGYKALYSQGYRDGYQANFRGYRY